MGMLGDDTPRVAGLARADIKACESVWELRDMALRLWTHAAGLGQQLDVVERARAVAQQDLEVAVRELNIHGAAGVTSGGGGGAGKGGEAEEADGHS